MGKSLRAKLVFIMLLVIVLLMVAVLVFFIRGVQEFFTSQFYAQMEIVISQTELVSELRRVAMLEDAVYGMGEVLKVFAGELGIDRSTRHYYVLDGATGETLMTSSTDESAALEITPSITSAIIGTEPVKGSTRAGYMDVAVPIFSENSQWKYLLYIIDNKQTTENLINEMYGIILRTVGIGFVISIVISLFISQTLLSPIKGMTSAAKSMADGDFSTKINVESDDEIGILATTFNDMAQQIETMLEELRKAEKLRQEFVANVSHELRTPLTSIRTYAETISETEQLAREKQTEFLNVILNESDRMAEIVRDLLELSRFDSGTTVMSVSEFSVEQSLRNIYIAVALEAQRHEQEINMNVENELPMIKGDRSRIEQVFMNIVSNALKYTPDGGRIDIICGCATSNIWIKISDTGIGIPEADLGRVFDRFYRVDKARARESGGTGLGLSIAKEIISRHNGDISIESKQGEGTTVTITLPIEGVVT
ncbi:MAG: cell wall metabolism sensor histidine kinase WalK [Oscillospiraceae bacterium]|nr:cell wall metabolism sensor histidine kinase WalK [Oscillospiraceae bacterium]